MYEMTLDGNTFFAPANEKYTFIAFEQHEALNDAGYLDATVPYSNPLYDDIKPAKSKVELSKDGKVIFRGKVKDVSLDFNNNKVLYIVGELSYLIESVQTQMNIKGFSKAQLLERLLAVHNQQSEEKFYPGRVAVNSDISAELLDYGYTLDIIKAVICAETGYIKIVYRNGRREIDILPIEAYGKQSKQYIRFGSNLLDYVQNFNTDSLATAILPRGNRLENAAVEGLDSYLTIESVNGGSPILVNQSGVNNFGYKCRIVDFETDDPKELLALAKNWLSTYQFIGMSINIRSVDLSMVDSSQDDYEVGDYVRATAEPFNLDTWLPVRAKDTNILDLAQNVIEMGLDRTETLTESTATGFTSITERLPQQNTILETAKKNATALIIDHTTGYVTVRNDEITIADNPDIKLAQKIWRWNMGGLGYSNDGGKTYGLAMTMDGSIVADYVTTGTLRSIRIENGQKPDGSVPFYVTERGELYAESGTFKGDVSAASLGGGAGNTLQQAINTANQAIQMAQSAANSAQSTATQAQSTAQIAQGAANTANNAAQVAQSAANTAKSVADKAKSTADTAYDYANRIQQSIGAHLGGWEWVRIRDKDGNIIYSGWFYTSHDRAPGW